ncbi:PilZ domain-containing protein [Thermomonas sp.]|uniref:PilZ domain-containing protein n=1 Tax=Thermomonas sp. TaxID=1971895 RepID=UPI002486D02B|nr:PilZ domain-containing protein [Thermomonas sp.]MDI1251731.1 PilZ domain-containing protein [Thermomonas sp.]
MGRESRRMHRRDVAGMIDVIDTMTGQSMGHLGNLSVGGMLLIASVPLTEDALYQCRFVLPDSDEGSIEVGAHVLWFDDASAPGQSWAGVRFLGLDPDTTRRLRIWCQPKQ